MKAILQPAPPDATVPMEEPAGGLLRCNVQSSLETAGTTHARIRDDVADKGARRIGVIAILAAVTVVGAAILQAMLQPEIAAAERSPLFRLSALFFCLAGVGLAALQRAEVVAAQELLDLGLVFEIAGSCALALMENATPWPDSALRGSSQVTAWIAICVVAIPNLPWKSIAAAAISAAMVPCAHIVASHVIGSPALPWHRLLIYALGPAIVAGWTPFISTHMHRMQQDLSRAREFGSYHLEKLLGRGGMGEVWLARHRLLCREAAVKLVLAGLLEKAGPSERRLIRKRFEAEAQAAASLRLPHTVAIYDYGLSENGSLFYAMEFLQGLDAERLVKEYGPQPAGRVVSILRQAADSLEEAHDAGLVHRDIKPSNLFIARLGKRIDFVKVLDFGLVKAFAGAAQTALTTNGTSGTPAFMSPEQVRGEEVDARTDIYGLGCAAYFLLTGSVVFHKSGLVATAIAHLTDMPEPPSRRSELPIPESLERVVMACLEKKPEDRPQSAAELRSMLDACTDFPAWTEADAKHWWSLHRPESARRQR